MLTDRELATVLAALRLWQRLREGSNFELWHKVLDQLSPDEEDGLMAILYGAGEPLTYKEIDDLYLRLNVDLASRG